MFGGGGEANKPGSHGWRPSADEVRRAEGSHGHLVLRLLSIVPFMLAGVVGIIALVSWIAVVVFGLGTSYGPIWHWAAGRPAHEVATQVGLAILVAVACAAFVILMVAAAGYGYRPSQARWFWPLAEAVCGVLALALLVGRTSAATLMHDLGLTGAGWYFTFAFVAFAMVVMGMRARRWGDDGEDGHGGGDGHGAGRDAPEHRETEDRHG